jgi:hypothetical protein
MSRCRAFIASTVAHAGSFFGFDVAPDGKRVLALFPSEDADGLPSGYISAKLNAYQH